MLIINATWPDRMGRMQTGSLELMERRIRFPRDVHYGRPDLPIFDARDKIVLPGFIDCHTHLREPGQEYKEGIDNGSRAAVKGGVTTVLDMPNNSPPCTTGRRLETKRRLFKEHCRTNWGLHFQATARGPLPQPEKIVSAKVYMAKSSEVDPVTTTRRLSAIFGAYRVVTVHAEDETAFRTTAKTSARRKGTKTGTLLRHHKDRPVAAIKSALDKVEAAYLSLPAGDRPRLILAHISTGVEVDWLSKMKEAGLDVWGETCPHYCLFSREDYLRRGNVLKVNPPLRAESDRTRVMRALRRGPIDILSTDHAPHSPAEKADLENPPSGIASIEWLAPIAVSLVHRKTLTWDRLLELVCVNPSRCFSIRGRDGIAEGNYADMVVIRQEPLDPSANGIVTRAAAAPYANFEFTCSVSATIVNGKVMYADGLFAEGIPGREVCR